MPEAMSGLGWILFSFIQKRSEQILRLLHNSFSYSMLKYERIFTGQCHWPKAHYKCNDPHMNSFRHISHSGHTPDLAHNPAWMLFTYTSATFLPDHTKVASIIVDTSKHLPFSIPSNFVIKQARDLGDCEHRTGSAIHFKFYCPCRADHRGTSITFLVRIGLILLPNSAYKLVLHLAFCTPFISYKMVLHLAFCTLFISSVLQLQLPSS